MTEKIIYINRGLPGSGKSTKALTLAPKENIFSTDEYWMKDGRYVFNARLLGEAHSWNTERVRLSALKGITPIVVDNTNVRRRDFEPYVKIANTYGYTVVEAFPDSPWWNEIRPRIANKTFTDADVKVFCEKNTHSVPFESIKNMMTKWED
jgi:NEDD4-binding protein 2